MDYITSVFFLFEIIVCKVFFLDKSGPDTYDHKIAYKQLFEL